MHIAGEDFVSLPASFTAEKGRDVPLAIICGENDNYIVSSKETVIQFVSKLPEGMPLAEIAREIELLAGIQTARDQARRKEGVSAEDARKLVDAWASK